MHSPLPFYVSPIRNTGTVPSWGNRSEEQQECMRNAASSGYGRQGRTLRA